MRKFTIGLLVILFLIILGVIAYALYTEYGNSDKKQQLVDVNEKIAQLPELEEDIFAKCMEGKSGRADELKTCQDTTQKEIHTLSQDLSNLKSNLEAELR